MRVLAASDASAVGLLAFFFGDVLGLQELLLLRCGCWLSLLPASIVARFGLRVRFSGTFAAAGASPVSDNLGCLLAGCMGSVALTSSTSAFGVADAALTLPALRVRLFALDLVDVLVCFAFFLLALPTAAASLFALATACFACFVASSFSFCLLVFVNSSCSFGDTFFKLTRQSGLADGLFTAPEPSVSC